MIRVSILGCFGIHCLGLMTFAVLSWPSCSSSAQAVSVRMHEGPSYGYIALPDAKGKIIASGEAIQNVHGQRIESRLVLHFKDGSIDDDTSMDLPVGLSDGIFFTVIRNLKITGSEVEVPYLAVSSNPRLITLAISLDGTDR